MEQEILYGVVTAVVYQNPENGYAVLRFRTQEGETVTVVGTIPMTAAGERLAVTGRWTAHASYGRQFEAELLERYLPESRDEILSYLSSRAIKGVGERTAQRIVAAFGEKSLEVLENEPDRLAQVPGISASKAREISENFRRQVGMRRLIEFLAQYHLPAALALRLYRAYGEVAVDAVQEEPYMLLRPYYGASFGQVDQFALAMGFETDDPQRVEAGVLFELTYNLSGGHVFIPREKLAAVTAELISLETEPIDQCIGELIQDGQLCYEEVAGCRACYLPELYEAETNAAERFAAMSRRRFNDRADVNKLLASLEKSQGIKYAPMQRSTLELALKNQLLVITGGPGTGKTTSIRAILAMFEQLGLKTLLTAPTGRAAKRMPEIDALMREIDETILQRFLKGVREEKLDYRGIIYAGIMVTKDGPKVLEFNVRFGDPETEAILPRLESSLADVLLKTALGKVADIEMKWSPKPSVCIVMASEGYPGTLRKGFAITGIEEAEKDGVIVFHAGTAMKDGVLVNAGGRVLVVTADGETVTDAIAKAYEGVAKIRWTGVQYRHDIAQRAVNRK